MSTPLKWKPESGMAMWIGAYVCLSIRVKEKKEKSS
jgi:hypothetical protein